MSAINEIIESLLETGQSDGLVDWLLEHPDDQWAVVEAAHLCQDEYLGYEIQAYWEMPAVGTPPEAARLFALADEARRRRMLLDDALEDFRVRAGLVPDPESQEIPF